MEFSRRGPATDGNRFPDPPPHGDPMLVIRNTLLSQLRNDRLRQEMIVAELAKIERAMALRDSFGLQATPMPRQGIADAGAGRSPFSIEQSMPGWEHVGKLPDKDGCQRVAESKSGMPVVVEDGAGECFKPCEVKADQRTAAFGEQKLLDSSETIPLSKTPPAAKWQLIGITIPVKKPKPPMKWNCDVCQVQATSEQNLQQHCAGQKHQSNVAKLDPETKASQKAKIPSEPSSHGSEQKRTSSIKWSCSTCQASGTCESDLEAHLKSTRHQQNVADLCKEGDGSDVDMPKNDVPHEAKLSDFNVPKHSQKPPSVWSCSICQVICTSEFDLKSHLQGRRHLAEVQAQKPPSLWSCIICQVTCTCESNLKSHLEGRRHLAEVQALLVIKSMTRGSGSEKPKSNPNVRLDCRICQAHCTCESGLENHFAGRRHQLNIQALREKANQKNNPPQIFKKQKLPSEWNCPMCQAMCNSKSQFEDHCRSSRHQQKVDANELPARMQNQKWWREKQQPLYFCEVCNVCCNSGQMLTHHLTGKKHQAKLNAQN